MSTRVAIVMPLGSRRGGSEQALLELLAASPDLDMTFQVLFLENGPMVDEVRRLGARAEVVPAGRLRQLDRYGRTIYGLARRARRAKSNTMVGWMTKGQLYASPAARLAGIPSAWHQLDFPSKAHLFDRFAALLPTSSILACSQAVAAAQARLWPRHQTTVLYLGVDTEYFDPSLLPQPRELRTRLQLPTDGPVIGIVGRLQHWKGIHLLIEIMPALLQSHPTATLVVVGGRHDLEPDYPPHVEARIQALGLEGSVILAGQQQNVREWMHAMDVVVHASDKEPFGKVVIEAMALGKPVVASDRGGPAEVITSGVDGLLWRHPDTSQLLDCVERCISDPTLARQLGIAARQRAMEFSTRRYAESFLTAVSRIMREEAVPARPS